MKYYKATAGKHTRVSNSRDLLKKWAAEKGYPNAIVTRFKPGRNRRSRRISLEKRKARRRT